MNLPTKSNPIVYLDITLEQAEQRIDNFLLTYLKGVPKSHIYRILRTGEVRVNKGRIKPTYRLQAGDKLRLPPLRQPEQTVFTPHTQVLQTLADAILYEDPKLLVINKAAGMAVHGGSGIAYGVIEGLRVLYPHAPCLELVHRLDRETSGCLLIAKKHSMLRRLHELLRNGHLHKHYIALVQGQWQSHLTKVDVPLCKNVLQSGERIVRVSPEGKPSISQFEIEQQFSVATLVKVQPLTGRTHQIRVHTACQGHPIAGDDKYGNNLFNQTMRAYGLKRLFLHALSIQIDLPEQDYHITVTAPLPNSLHQVLQRLS